MKGRAFVLIIIIKILNAIKEGDCIIAFCLINFLIINNIINLNRSSHASLG